MQIASRPWMRVHCDTCFAEPGEYCKVTPRRREEARVAQWAHAARHRTLAKLRAVASREASYRARGGYV